MKVVNYTKARNNLRSLIDEAVDNNEEVVITTKDDKTVVMIPLARYNVSYEQIKEDIEISLKQIEAGDTLSIDEAFKEAKRAYKR
ncbi:type II toxin-antitoxin system Phd/YefM family antitoxin [Hydrogenimonas sp.]